MVSRANDKGGVANANDCDPDNPNIADVERWYADRDSDGYGDPNDFVEDCVQPSLYVSNSQDLCPNDENKSEPGTCGCGVEEGTCIDCNGENGGTAYYDACGTCAGGSTGVIPVDDPDACAPVLSTNEELFGNGLAVYPNPTSGNLQIENMKDGQNWVLYTPTGVVLKEGNSTQINLSYEEGGIYLLQIEGAVFKVIKE